ncbi:MAG: methyltransferase [Kofleriaceae bacterium]
MSRETWAREFAATARAHWTEARTRELTDGKQLAILPGEAPLLLRALGLLRRDATMPPREVRKFLQINNVVRVLRPTFDALHAKHGALRVLDAGCGRSYLTLLVAWSARQRGQPLEVIGVDRDAAVIAECQRRTEVAELADVVKFVATPLEALAGPDPFHAVFALHACDTATCDAIAIGVARQAELVAVAPCCQAELARAWTALADDPAATGAFAPIWRAPHLRRETAAHMTDAMRTLLLRSAGYDVTAMEFIAAEHTRKNTLLRALRHGVPDPVARAEYDALVAATGGRGLALASRL